MKIFHWKIIILSNFLLDILAKIVTIIYYNRISIYLNFFLKKYILLLLYLYLASERHKNKQYSNIQLETVQNYKNLYKSPPNNFFCNEEAWKSGHKRREARVTESESLEYLFGRGEFTKRGAFLNRGGRFGQFGGYGDR